jgi:SNF2 family DNA or RNA helicase
MRRKFDKYVFKTEPYDHQRSVFRDSWHRECYALFMEMGTGKSKIVVDTIALLQEVGEIDTVLIVAPKGVFHNWVRKEIPAHLPDRIEHSICAWQPNITQKYRDEFQAFINSDKLKIFVMNVEAFSTSKGAETAAWFAKKFGEKGMMVVDESTAIKNRKANRTKAIVAAGKFFTYKRLLTGSPVTKSPMDLFSQCLFLGDNYLGYPNYYAFQGRYAVVQRRSMGHRSFQQIVGFQRLDELNLKLDDFSSRVLKKECLDLPEKVYIRREVELTSEQKKLYRQMSKLALAELQDGSLVSTNNVLTQIMRLQQICCGHVKDDQGFLIDIDNNRLDELLNICEETSGKVIIWANWVHDIVNIDEALAIRFGRKTVQSYYGSTEASTRQNVVEEFQNPDSPMRFFVGNSRTGGMGITLTEASTVIYYSNNYDLEIRVQSEDRAHRIGQKNNVTYIDLVSPRTIDEKILTALQNKQNIASTVLGEELREWFQ